MSILTEEDTKKTKVLKEGRLKYDRENADMRNTLETVEEILVGPGGPGG